MTEAELWNAHLLAVGNGNGGPESVLTIIFAYLAAAYFVGAKLSRLQVALGTLGSVIAFGLTAFVTVVEYRQCIYFIERLTADYGIEPFSPNFVILPFMSLAMVLLIPGCIYFMHQMRSSRTPGEGIEHVFVCRKHIPGSAGAAVGQHYRPETGLHSLE